MTKLQIAAIARSTKVCHPSGLQKCITVWADGNYTECTDRNEVTARNTPDGIEDRLCAISHPVTIAGAAEIIAQAEARRTQATAFPLCPVCGERGPFTPQGFCKKGHQQQ